MKETAAGFERTDKSAADDGQLWTLPLDSSLTRRCLGAVAKVPPAGWKATALHLFETHLRGSTLYWCHATYMWNIRIDLLPWENTPARFMNPSDQGSE